MLYPTGLSLIMRTSWIDAGYKDVVIKGNNLVSSLKLKSNRPPARNASKALECGLSYIVLLKLSHLNGRYDTLEAIFHEAL